MVEGNFRKLVDHAEGFESAKFELGHILSSKVLVRINALTGH